jgi:hypothetical protein
MRAHASDAVVWFACVATLRDGSDLDFLVIERDVANRAVEMARLRNALPPLEVPVDVIVVSEAHVAKWGPVKGTMVRAAPRWARAGSLPSPETLELARRFLRKAYEDREAVEILSGSDRAADAVVGFHAQPAVEKFVKAVLTVRGIDAPPTRDLRFCSTAP